MGYHHFMNVRPAPPLPADAVIDEPITDAGWNAMSVAERAFLQQGIDALDRGEFISHDEMKREFQRMREKYAAIRRIELRLDEIDSSLAGRITDEIEARIERLLMFPQSGPALGIGSFRKLSIVRFDYIVLYRITRDAVEIVRVRHAHEDWVAR
jgi:toxin ParE1/3/4